MTDLKILFIIFALLFILEYKSINILAYYVGMVIIIAIIICNYEEINNHIFIILETISEEELLFILTGDMMYIPNIAFKEISKDIGYISYILILVQISALTIIFGLIIMLYPKNNTDVLINKKNILSKIGNKNKEKRKKKKYIIIIISLLLLLLIIKNLPVIINIDYNSILKNMNNIINIDYNSILKNMNYIIYVILTQLSINMDNIIYEILTQYSINMYNMYNIPGMENNTTTLLKIISTQMYSELSNIIKFMVITIILLFAIIGLFFLLLPTKIKNRIEGKL